MLFKIKIKYFYFITLLALLKLSHVLAKRNGWEDKPVFKNSTIETRENFLVAHAHRNNPAVLLPLVMRRRRENYAKSYGKTKSGKGNGWTMGRELSANTLQGGALASSSDYAYADMDEYGSYAAETGYGHGGGHGGGYGGGHGGGGGGHGKGDCNSALGLLGVIGLASYLQNVLRQMTTTMAPAGGGGRRVRALPDSFNHDPAMFKDKQTFEEPDTDKLLKLLLPFMTAVAHARDRLIPLRCTHRYVCLANALLVKELGDSGRFIGSILSAKVGEMLQSVDKSGSIVKEVNKISKAGRSGTHCNKVYKYCPALSQLPSYAIPSGINF